MAAANSPVTGEAYGVRRVCAAWGMPRSSFYAARTVSEAPPPGRRRGPRPVVDDAGLLEAIRRDLDRSPFSGGACRKVFGVYPALSMRAAYAPPNRRWPMILSAIAEKLKRRARAVFALVESAGVCKAGLI